MDKYSITKINKAQLFIATKPFSEGLFTSELRKLKKKFQNVLICSVLSNLEILKYNLTKEGDICAQNSVEFLHLSIADESIPGIEDFKNLVNTLFVKTKTCDVIIIHCKHGMRV